MVRVAVVGLGTMGSQAVWRLAARGAEVIGFEQFAPGHDRGAAGGETRIFRSAHFEDPRYVPVLRQADELWRVLESETGRQLRDLTGCLLMGPPEHHQMATALRSVEEHGLDHELLDAAALADRFPQFRLDAGDLALLDHRAGYIRPELSVLTAARRAEELGAEVRRHSRVREIEPTRSGVKVRTDTETVHVDRVVVTTGPWAGDLLPHLRERITVRRPVSAWYVPRSPGWFGAGTPAFIRTAPTHCYGVPSVDRISMKLGLSFAYHRVVDDPDTVDRTVQPGELERFTELIERYLPGLQPDPIRVSAYLEGYTEDSRPIVGPAPGAEDIIVLAGFSGHGFKLSPAIGDIAADFALLGATSRPIEFMSLTATEGSRP